MRFFRKVTFLCAACMTAAAMPVTMFNSITAAAISDSVYQGLKYQVLNNNTVMITGIENTQLSKVIIPSEIEGRTVEIIGERALFHTDITDLQVSEGVKEIGEAAFCGCALLTHVEIADTVSSIGENAFAECCALESIDIPTGISKISWHMFWGCTGLKSVVIPDNIKEIEALSFTSCYNLESVEIAKSVTRIGYMAFNCYWGDDSPPEDKPKLSTVTILNPNLIFYEDEYGVVEGNLQVFPKSATIRGYNDSTAQFYAEKFGYNFESLGEAPAQKTGDFDGDGEIGAEDAQNVLTLYAESVAGNEPRLTDAQKKAADVNGDGTIDVADAQLILLYYVQNTVTGIPTDWKDLIS